MSATTGSKKQTTKRAVKDTEVKDKVLETKLEVEKDISKKKELELIDEKTFKLGVSIGIGINLPKDTTTVEVSNLGAGDVYVDPTKLGYNRDNAITPGESKSFSNITSLMFISTCRPTIVVKSYK